MKLDKLDPGALLSYQRYLDNFDDPDRPQALSVVLTFDGDLATVAAHGFEVAWSGGDSAVGTLSWNDLDAITELPEVWRPRPTSSW